MRRILALGAHYDDVEIGVGGTLMKHLSAKDEVFIAVTNSDEHRTGDVNRRYGEQLDALKVLELQENRLLLFKDTDELSVVIGSLDTLRPDVVYTMFELDTHQAHRKCSHIGQSVGRKLSIQLVFYNSGSSYNFYPNVFSIIDFEFKKKLLRCFQSQIKLKAINLDIIQRRESFWASVITEDAVHAEGFVVRKMLYEV
jgi:LmbE family N-acetylglucosaminyl deacetylase